jgi:magnesium transporter
MTSADRPHIPTLISTLDAPALADWAAHSPSADVADALEALEPADRSRLFARLPDERQPEVFHHLDHEARMELFHSLEEPQARQLLEQLETDDRTRLFEQLAEEDRDRMLALLGPEARRETDRQLRYPPDSVGRLMSFSFAAVAEEWRVADALNHIRTLDLDPIAVGTVYVTGPQGRLVDALDLPRVVLADPDVRVRDIMDGIYVAVTPTEDREEAVRLMQKHDLIALPVVDTEGLLVGVVSVDDVLDVAREEATEDIQKQAGMAPLRATYPDVAAWSLFQARLPWLAALIFVYLAASGVISAFEEALAAELVLAAFIPLLMGSGGNVGAQSGTLMVRALAVGDLEGGRWLTALSKELLVGVVLGVALGILAGIVAYFRGGADVAVVVAASMALIVVAANLTGTLLPVLLVRIGIDPAVAGSPVITSITDLTSLLIYLGMASQLLAI